MSSPPKVLILGIGNLLWADEGFGVRCVEALAAGWRFPPNVTLLDGGTQGIYLVDQVREADVLVVFDAVDYGLAPGTLKRVEGDAVPKFMGAKKMSLHQTGFQEVLALAELLGGYPAHLLLIGVQPLALEDFGGSLRPEIRGRIGPAIAIAFEYLRDFGITPSPLDRVAAQGVNLPHPALGITAYELGRPAPEQACRVGDARVLSRIPAAAGAD
ncbi:MAG: HyaD/HybD family hydrogenase maturation endopeptidase [Thiohalocapsa sp.]|nr:HyaD/HybD family hydrogenase maturation endopeptidase [Thiohalocapsa sp.]MCF7989086.1 HyaD/HybD family hydrogenase maturation endopeptidase [Thiohalocapsa sp.]